MKTQIGQILAHHSAKGQILHYYCHVMHPGLNKSRLIKASSPGMVGTLAEMQAKEWANKWNEVCEKQDARNKKAEHRSHLSRSQNEAVERTEEAQFRLEELKTLLVSSLETAGPLDLKSLKITADFSGPKPKKEKYPDEPKIKDVGPEPIQTNPRYLPKINFLEKLLGFGASKIKAAQLLFENDHAYWIKDKVSANQEFESAQKTFKSAIKEIDKQYKNDVNSWEQAREDYKINVQNQNAELDLLDSTYATGDSEAIVHYTETVLSHSDYPNFFPKEFELEYTPETKTLLIEYLLPYIDELPTLREVKFIQTREEFQEKHISQADLNKLFDEVIYQTALRTIYEVFKSDPPHHIESIVFNGIVNYVDKSSGHNTSACIISIQASKEEFLAINLGLVDPKACFKNLKGVASSKLHGISPIAPIMNIQRDDSRFVAAHDVADTMDDSTNLAAMDWQDFEHLIRELFAKEFSTNGGEVKITQASRDGGVDAIAFDPDPIRGGKIVIQAKRYTNTVTVSAVRDLYGTVLNEGANKGVLVTTSDYGPDAYSFAKDKPLVLLNGANLLHLMSKHGHKARIDIKEAKLQQRNS
ncbi:restriction endonuclease [Polynucleobacter sp. Latsch14-2]|jgi:restriction system protein|uniref:restriction endonuclease n=1 Tax=Polynucleobacter sp. Latsch14-2 TaxID=2576920 RepID=UPI001BFDC811|nr:restriction endonuclease [Polynucleobacter sp. Latsch14-2]MBT8573489.1 restriction endonuclease [Polynucleobacter paneuropaeus]MBT8606765.1 restriction endonuclease [Polynucleobacter paneuropaeus]MBU3614548.1 restriction endonuclease [Polynucleobacter sp. Latsch14-2]